MSTMPSKVKLCQFKKLGPGKQTAVSILTCSIIFNINPIQLRGFVSICETVDS